MSNQAFQKELAAKIKGTILCDEPMHLHTSWRIGGPADIFVDVAGEDDIAEVLILCKKHKVPCQVVGRGSNLLVLDKGIRGVVLHIGKGLSQNVWQTNGQVQAGAGGLLMNLVRETVQQGLGGLEWAAGIPGSVGGAVWMNAGAYGEFMGNFVTHVNVIEYTGCKRQIFLPELDFAYRKSGLMDLAAVITSITLKLQPRDAVLSQKKIEELLALRQKNQPLEYPSAGSVFKNPGNDHAGRLSEAAGCKGLTVGGAQVSLKHGNFIINTGEATAADVLALIGQVQKKVKEAFGIDLQQEIKTIGEI